MALVRVTVTLPAAVLKEADRRARELDRSRSWVVAEALRTHLGGPAVVREGAAPPYAVPAAELERARLSHLETELALAPAERLERAEELARLARSRQRRGRRHQVIGFESWEDYEQWKTAQRIGG